MSWKNLFGRRKVEAMQAEEEVSQNKIKARVASTTALRVSLTLAGLVNKLVEEQKEKDSRTNKNWWGS